MDPLLRHHILDKLAHELVPMVHAVLQTEEPTSKAHVALLSNALGYFGIEASKKTDAMIRLFLEEAADHPAFSNQDPARNAVWSKFEYALAPMVFAIIHDRRITPEEFRLTLIALSYFGIQETPETSDRIRAFFEAELARLQERGGHITDPALELAHVQARHAEAGEAPEHADLYRAYVGEQALSRSNLQEVRHVLRGLAEVVGLEEVSVADILHPQDSPEVEAPQVEGPELGRKS